MLHSDVARSGSPTVAPGAPPPPTPPSLSRKVQQSVHDVFVHLETLAGHVYNRRKDDVEQEGREHAPLAKANHPELNPSSSHTIARKLS